MAASELTDRAAAATAPPRRPARAAARGVPRERTSIEFRGVSKGYDGGDVGLDQATFAIAPRRVRVPRRLDRLGQVDDHAPADQGARADRRARSASPAATSARSRASRSRTTAATSAWSSRTSSCCRTARSTTTSPTRCRSPGGTRKEIREKVPDILRLTGPLDEAAQLPRPALRRRAAARLDRARVRQPPAAAAGRRADRQPRSRDGRSGSCSCSTGSTAPARPCSSPPTTTRWSTRCAAA